MTENERFGLVFVKTWSINSGTEMVTRHDFILYYCCGTVIETTETVTFCISGTGMHYVSGFGAVFRSEYIIKWCKKRGQLSKK
jgi:hypothetical protein